MNDLRFEAKRKSRLNLSSVVIIGCPSTENLDLKIIFLNARNLEYFLVELVWMMLGLAV